jgi:hypothetical protein
MDDEDKKVAMAAFLAGCKITTSATFAGGTEMNDNGSVK